MAVWPDYQYGLANSLYGGLPSVELLRVVYHAEQAGKTNVTFGFRQRQIACVNRNPDKLTAILAANGEGPPAGHVIVFDSIANLGSAISS